MVNTRGETIRNNRCGQMGNVCKHCVTSVASQVQILLHRLYLKCTRGETIRNNRCGQMGSLVK